MSRPLVLLLGMGLLASGACIMAYFAVTGTSDNLLLLLNNRKLLVPRVRTSHLHIGLPSDCCVKYKASLLSPDNRGWLVDPVATALRAGIHGAATTCKSTHIGQIKPHSLRGNHRHHFCNETFIVWGARTKFRVELSLANQEFFEIETGADEVGIFGGPAGRAHALLNVDDENSTYFLGCQDALNNDKSSGTDYNVWKNW